MRSVNWGMSFTVMITISSLLGIGCASTKKTTYSPTEPIKSTGTVFASYEQNNEPVSTMDVIQDLKKDEATRGQAETAELLQYSSIGFAAVGGFELGRGLVRTLQNQSGTTDFIIGTGALGAGILTSFLSTKSLNNAVETKNERNQIRKAATTSTPPSLFLSPQVEFNRVYFPKLLGLGAGVKFTF